MKKITGLFISISLAIGVNTMVNAQPYDDGFYKAHDDFIKGKLIEQGWITSVRNKVQYYPVSDKDKEKKYSIKDNTYWGCRQDGESFRFYDGDVYRILLSGKITLYSTGPIKPIRDKQGNITRVEMETGSGGKTLYYHPGQEGAPKKMTNQKEIGKLLEDDPEVHKKYTEGKSIASVAIFMNVINCVQLYNARHK